MNYKEYAEAMKDVGPSEKAVFKRAVIWLNAERLPMGVISFEGEDDEIIRIPAYVRNEYGVKVPVIAIAQQAFQNRTNVTDIILPSGIERLPERAFAGCSNLKNITIPKKIKVIKEGTFDGCTRLENVYYEGTREEWERVEIVHERHEIDFGPLIPGTSVQQTVGERMMHVPGNDALFTANIHFGCALEKGDGRVFQLKAAGKDISALFRIM